MNIPIANPNLANLPPELEAVRERSKDFYPIWSEGSAFTAAMTMIQAKNAAWDQFMTAEGHKKNPYHSVDHFDTVHVRCQKVCKVMHHDILLTVEQALMLAAQGHDLCHPGFGDRLTMPANRPRIYPQLGGITNERASNLAVHEIMRMTGISPHVMMMVWGMIESTQFVGKDPGAHTVGEAIIRACDIAVDRSPMDWFCESARVLAETPLEKRPPTFQKWVEGRAGFLKNWVRPRMEMVPASMKLWGHHLDAAEQYVQRMLTNDQGAIAQVKGIVEQLLPIETTAPQAT